ncbi:hypothetical protein M0813_14353 [Anaeramoeba flamelloides]|uniref:SnoaL-like domain-containing protein n=1 Tax=Anaeramoeba flamelloides TaxID=1746091 RepID=A0AAV7ZU73_9EUKA|nr:hypothetical protein M0812_10023 [Anaeramoeba flamelloides]KAJ6252203.1 hypothetical protein M0813_14353 [Anaeramoeba flamelloides]
MEAKIQQLLDEREIINVVNTMATSYDQGEWDRMRSCLPENFTLDVTSFVGGEVLELKPDKLIEMWSAVRSNLDNVQHMLTNHKVTIDGDKADIFCYIQSTQWLKTEEKFYKRKVQGSYTHKMIKTKAGWKIKKFIFQFEKMSGDPNFPQKKKN